ncbi:MAG: hypothetical protein ACXABN_04890 [Candidatus Thorarchaeota archaeon]|jgi:hypothetical protein
MRRAVVLPLLFIILFVSPIGDDSVSSTDAETFTPSQGSLDIARNWSLNIVIVGYDHTKIDEAILLTGMPTERVYSAESVDITYNIDYNIEYTDASYYNDLQQVMLDNSENGTDTGTWLNQTALMYQKSHLDEPQRIFYPRDGRMIDAYAVEDWLVANPYVAPPDLGYTLYLVNFSEFDTPDLEHWYDYHPVDPDTGEEQDWFRLEWDNALNPNVTMDYQSFGGRHNIHVVDPSAHQWYLKWCKIWWSESIGTEYDFWTQDLEDKMATLDMGVPADVDALNVYLNEIIWDPINQLFFPYQHQPASYVEKGTYKGLVICMDVASGVSTESLEWVIDAEMMKQDLEALYPFIDWTVDIEFLDIDQEPAWNSLFWMHAYVDSGTTIADGGAMFDTIYDVMKPQYTVDDDNINVFGVVFIKKQMEMHVYGRTYTGLGGGGQTVIWKSWERYYRPDGVTPKDGISSVQLHETMHAVGFHHTWQHEHYSSDFSWGPMGYFAFREGTATYDKNWVQGTYLDQMEAILWDELMNRPQTEFDRPETELAEARAHIAFNTARELYDEMDWMGAYEALLDAKDWIRRVYSSIMDSTPPVIHDWGTLPEGVGTDEFIYWAEVSDDLAGLENVTLFVQVDEGDIQPFLCSNSSDDWSVTVPSQNTYTNLTMWLVAHDWGMNSISGGRIEVLTTPFGSFSDLLIPLAVAAGTSCVVIGIGVYLMKRRQ